MSNIARIINGKIVYDTDPASVIQSNDMQARASREDQKTRYRKEMLQKNQVEFYRAYPDQAKNLSPELRRLLS